MDLSALRANLACAHKRAPGSRIMAVVKANAYGHGIIPVARALADADGLAVASLDEALTLRAAGITQAILLLEGCFDAAELAQASHHALSLVVHSEAQITLLEGLQSAYPGVLWLKVNTGMNRLGIAADRVVRAYARLAALCQDRRVPTRNIVLMTHLANADQRADPVTSIQLRRFSQATQGLPGPRSIANSAGILAWPESHADWVRPGIMLYGASPFPDTVAAEEGLLPVMTLRSRLIALQSCRPGDAIGYGGSWRCPEAMMIGVVAVGYGDAYPRHAPSGTPVLVRGQCVPLVGRVSMDMIMVDLRSLPDACVGDEVILWGAGLPVETIAGHADTISYELFCHRAQRVPVYYSEVRDGD